VRCAANKVLAAARRAWCARNYLTGFAAVLVLLLLALVLFVVLLLALFVVFFVFFVVCRGVIIVSVRVDARCEG